MTTSVIMATHDTSLQNIGNMKSTKLNFLAGQRNNNMKGVTKPLPTAPSPDNGSTATVEQANGPSVTTDGMSNGPSIGMDPGSRGMSISGVGGSHTILPHSDVFSSSVFTTTRLCCVSTCIVKLLGGCVLMFFSSICLTAATELAKSTFESQDPLHLGNKSLLIPDNYESRAIFTVVYVILTSFMLLFPCYVLGIFVAKQGKVKIYETLSDCQRVFELDTMEPPQWYKVVCKCILFCVFWILILYIYIKALYYKPCVDIVALFATNSSFTYMLSWIILQRKFMAIRIVALIFALAGVCILIYINGHGMISEDMWGSALAVISAGITATYKISYNRFIGIPTPRQTVYFITCIGLFNLLTMWPFVLLAHFIGSEPIEWSELSPVYVVVIASSVIVMTAILNFGKMVTHQVYLQLSFVFAISLTLVFDITIRELQFNATQVTAYILISISGLLNILPEDWHTMLLKTLHWEKSRKGHRQVHLMSPRERLRSTPG